jgi:hypothetical protein
VPKKKRQPAEPPAAVPARTGAARPALQALATAVYVAWCAVCVAALVALVGLRWLRYSSWSAAPAINDFLREAMLVDAQTFLWFWAFSTVKAQSVALAVAIVVVCLHRRLLDHLVARGDGVWRLRRLPVAILLGAMVWFHYAFDLNPTVGMFGAVTLIALTAAEYPRLAARAPRVLALVAVGAVVVVGLFAAGDVVDRVTIASWGAVLLATHVVVSRVAPVHLALVRTAALIPVNIFSVALPLVVPMHGGTHFGDGHAYAFCEVPGRATVYASMPVCDSVRVGWDECRDGRIMEYAAASMRPVATHRFFSPDFYGRLESLLCLKDQVQVAVQGTMQNGNFLRQSAMSFPVAAPEKFVPVVAGPDYGIAMAYDESRDAIFYTAEFTDAVVRKDLRTGRSDDVGGGAFLNRWWNPFSIESFTGSSTLNTGSIHPGRNRVYLTEFHHGRYAYAIDLDTLKPVARYDVASGAGLGISVDPERDRLFVSSLWGLEVYDLATDRLIRRMRTGLGNRPVVVDRARNRLYVSSMVEGKIRILDRDTLEPIGQIPIGIGSRYAYLTRAGDRLLASSMNAQYWWDPDSLAPG